MLQATVCNSGPLDALAFCEDCLSSPEVDIGRSEVVEALVIADVVIVLDEGVDLPFEITGQIVVVEQDAALQGLVPTLDLALGLRMVGRTSNVAHAIIIEPFCEIGRDVARSVVAQETGFVDDAGLVTA